MGLFWNNFQRYFFKEYAPSVRFPTNKNNSHDSAMANEGSFIKIIDNIWYLFYRESWYANSPSYCNQTINVLFRIVVRYSIDFGQTWSQKVHKLRFILFLLFPYFCLVCNCFPTAFQLLAIVFCE